MKTFDEFNEKEKIEEAASGIPAIEKQSEKALKELMRWSAMISKVDTSTAREADRAIKQLEHKIIAIEKGITN